MYPGSSIRSSVACVAGQPRGVLPNVEANSLVHIRDMQDSVPTM